MTSPYKKGRLSLHAASCKNTRSFCRAVVHYDLTVGFAQTALHIIVSVLLFLLLNISYFVYNNNDVGSIQEPGLVDAWIYFFKGAPPFNAMDIHFVVPATWFVSQIYVLYIVLWYPIKDLNTNGVHLLIRSGNRKIWWVSKVCWVLVSVTLYYILLFTVTMICVKFKYVNLEYTDALLGIAPSTEGIIYSPQQYLKAFLSPLFSSYGYAILELVLSLSISPVLSFCAVFILNLMAVFFTSPLLFANLSMLARTDVILGGAIHFNTEMILIAAIVVLGCIIGCFLIEKKDLIGEKE